MDEPKTPNANTMSLPSSDESLWAVRSTINPYLHGINFMVRRLKWDLKFESWRSRHLLQRSKNIHQREKAVIVCNGPSLNRTDLTQLAGVYCIGMNKINLLFERSNFRPQCIVAINDLVIEQNRDFFNSTVTDLYLAHESLPIIRPRNNVTFLYTEPSYRLAKDCSISVCPGATVTTVALQLAFHLGFLDVALVGCDHNFVAKGEANKTVTAGSKDDSHFDPRYFSGGVKWQLPDLVASEFYYELARRMFLSEGRRVVNSTVDGKLEIFERMSLDEWLNNKLPAPGS